MEFVESVVKKIVAEHFGRKPTSISLNNKINELGGDIMDLTELRISIEEEFNIKIPEKDRKSIETVKDFVDAVVNNKDFIS